MLDTFTATSSTSMMAEILYWKDVREVVKKINPHLADIIDILDPGTKYKLIKLRYPYGVNIVNKGTIQIPMQNNEAIPYDDTRIPQNIQDLLHYSPIPLALLLNKNSEAYIEIDNRIVPLNTLHPGQIFGLFETLSVIANALITTPVWSVYSGVRSTFLLPKITDAISHRRLCLEYRMIGDSPKNPINQSSIFASINNQQPEEKRWFSEILVFSKDWFQNNLQDPAWLPFQNYLFKEGWIHTKYEFDNKGRQMLWESLASAIAKRRLKPRSYLIDTVKHLVSIGTGVMPGFRTADDSELSLPGRIIEEAYINIYKLEYLPIIMYPHMLRDSEINIPLYYFMTYPTLFAGSPTQRGTPSIIMDIREIKTVIETLYKHLNHNKLFYNNLSKIQFDYFHTEEDRLEEISHTAEIPNEDPALLKYFEKYPGKSFPTNAPFMPGCIRIRRISND